MSNNFASLHSHSPTHPIHLYPYSPAVHLSHCAMLIVFLAVCLPLNKKRGEGRERERRGEERKKED